MEHLYSLNYISDFRSNMCNQNVSKNFIPCHTFDTPVFYHVRLPHCSTVHLQTWKHTTHPRTQGRSEILGVHLQARHSTQSATVQTYAYHRGSSI